MFGLLRRTGPLAQPFPLDLREQRMPPQRSFFFLPTPPNDTPPPTRSDDDLDDDQHPRPATMYSPVASVLGPDDAPSLNVSSLSSSASSGSLFAYPANTPLLQASSEPSKKGHHAQSFSLSNLQIPANISPPSSASQFFPMGHDQPVLGPGGSINTANSMGSSSDKPVQRGHHKPYGNHSISHTVSSINGRAPFHPSHNMPKSRSISVSSPTDMLVPDFPRYSGSNMLGSDMLAPGKYHTRSLSSSIPHSRPFANPSPLLANSGATYSHVADLTANIIFENGTSDPRRNSYEALPPMVSRSPSFLQAETTADEFPILVRRESCDLAALEAAGPTDVNGFTDQHSFSQTQSPVHSLSNSLNGSNQSLSSMFSSCSLQPHPVLPEHITQQQLHKAHQIHQTQQGQHQQTQQMQQHGHIYIQDKPATRAKSFKASQQRPYQQLVNVQQTNSGKRQFSPNNVKQHNHQHQHGSQPQAYAPSYKMPQYRVPSYQHQHPAPEQLNRPPVTINRSVSAPFIPRHFNGNRRQHEAGAASRFTDAELDKFVGDIYSICKDQHGCRYLQKVLDERNPEKVEIIFNETKDHVTELMTDLFGNYLCQKLLECVNSDQRTVLVQNASPDLTKIALNPHGTRALQKMIEYSVAAEQVAIIVLSLKSDVVRLIQDLNGNHVIQKCLNHLSSTDSQFIIDAVSNNCVTVGTHRHGCCVLQRCIDHSSDTQKRQLITQIIENSFVLVQDPYGNYVIQYVLELGILEYSESLIQQFLGQTCVLSMQKFSSNVIEKCLRIALPETKQQLIEELVGSPFLDSLLRDSYANYVIQTTLEYADSATKDLILQSIIPILPSIRNTPYGRKIISKLAATHDASSLLVHLQQPPTAATPQAPQSLASHVAYQQHAQQQHSQYTAHPMMPYYGGFGVPPVGTLPSAAPVSMHDAPK